MKQNRKSMNVINFALRGASLLVLAETCTNAYAQQLTPVPDVSVTAPSVNAFTGIQAEGLASQGYKVKTATDVGPLGSLPLQDTPYSISVIPHELIENTFATSTDQIFQINPFTQLTTSNLRNGTTFVNIRGFSVSNMLVDGLKIPAGTFFTGLTPVDNLERVEVFTGLTGFLFGQTDPGGTVNYVLKRPTAKPFAELTLGDPGGGSGYGHLDIGGPIDPEGRFGYRINVSGQDGETNIAYAREQKQLYSGAFDWHITPNALLQVDYAHSYDIAHGTPPTFGLGVLGNTLYPSAPSANELWSQPWSSISNLTDRGGIRLTWDINSVFTFRSAFEASQNHESGGIYTQVVQNNGGLLAWDGVFAPNRTDIESEYGFLDAKFSTFSIDHKVTFGFSGTSSDFYTNNLATQDCAFPSGAQGFTNCLGGTAGTVSPVNIFGTPVYSYQPANEYANVVGPSYRNSNTTNNNIVLGDVATLTKGLDLIVGVTYSDIGAKSFNQDGSTASSYDKSAFTPSASLVFKPWDWVSTYATYIQGLEQGQIVPQGYTNAGQALAPAIDEQNEVGMKITAGNVLYTFALFRIDKVNQFSNNVAPIPTFVQDGREVHQGGEISATGKLTEDLTLVGGITAFDARVTQASTASLNGLRPQNVPDVLAKAYLEYRLPFFREIVLNGGVNFQSDYAANTANTVYYPSVATYNLGARYETAIDGHPLTFRVYATNILNKSYWMSAGQLGDPARVAFSSTIRF